MCVWTERQRERRETEIAERERERQRERERAKRERERAQREGRTSGEIARRTKHRERGGGGVHAHLFSPTVKVYGCLQDYPKTCLRPIALTRQTEAVSFS